MGNASRMSGGRSSGGGGNNKTTWKDVVGTILIILLVLSLIYTPIAYLEGAFPWKCRVWLEKTYITGEDNYTVRGYVNKNFRMIEDIYLTNLTEAQADSAIMAIKNRYK